MSGTVKTNSDSRAEEFQRDGALLLKNVLSSDWVQLLEDGLESAQENPDGMSAGVNQPLRIDQFPARHNDNLARLISDSPIAEIVASVLGAPVRFYMDQMFYKPAGMIAPSAWHQDTCYYNVIGSDLVRAWVCADPAPRNVSLEVVRGSHLWNITYRPPVGQDPSEDPDRAEALEAAVARGERIIGKEAFNKWTYFDSLADDSLPVLPDIEAQRDSFDILGWDYAPGDVILFHGNILHSARGGVHLAHPRRSHASLWAGPDVRYLHRRSQAIPDPIGLYDHEPKDGQPLSDFPDVFPLGRAPVAQA